MAMDLSCVFVCLVLTCIPGVWSIYFPQSLYEGILQSSDQSGDAIVRIFAIKNSTDGKDFPVTYTIREISGNGNGVHYSHVLDLDQAGWLYLTDPRAISTFSDSEIIIHVDASIGDHQSKGIASTEVHLAIVNSQEELSCSSMCFQDRVGVLHVEENSGPVKLALVGKSLHHGICDDVNISYTMTSFDVPSLSVSLNPLDWLYINNTSSEISLLVSFDREAWDEAELHLACSLDYNNGTLEKKQHTLSILVSDVDDSVPVLDDFKSSKQYKHIEWKFTEKKYLSILVADNDTAGTENYQIELRGNDNDWFHLSKTRVFRPTDSFYRRWNRTTFHAVVKVTKEKMSHITSTTFEIVFTDMSYLSTSSSQLKSEAVIEVSVVVPVQETTERIPKDHFNVELSRQAARYTQIFHASRIPDLDSSDAHFFMSGHSIFNVTQKKGILYVENPDALLISSKSIINVTMRYFSKTSRQRTFIVIVKISSDGLHTPVPCERSCAENKYAEECAGSCGLGAINGRCTMRIGKYPDRMTSQYSTCSPNLATCPDSICDELEKAQSYLCPQDCTPEVFGSSVETGHNNNSVGISSASGVCWCDTPESCQCWASHTLNKPKATKSEQPSAPATTLSTETQAVTSKPAESSATLVSGTNTRMKEVNEVGTATADPACDKACQAILSLGVVTIGVIGIVCLSVWWVQRRRKRRTDELRHVGSNVSMNAIPSDYVEERRTSHNSIEWSPKTINNQNGYDKKWEFPRKNLTLGKNLGEGEFGQVVKAQAYGLTTKDQYTTVAVKMLKNCSNESEYQDLVSEFNLLKDVSHPNVVKLLGACTKEEPLYIIVEYCEHGSLRHYLRTCRHNNSLYVESNGPVHGEGTPPVQVHISSGDLLSFAWQIAKGMHYLAEMKVVHRDLAARNVLVASGKVVKISDFGLSRDVYEADAYMKKSKGRIPVKWMAPESLYDQVYTTRSDVWSYGIVLWEIVTLGATPYPGIPPERLFGLLSTGYRMDRPDNCSDELYAVMQKCWKAEPLQRPSFFNLVNIFESMLQAKMEYLDLDGALRAPYDFEYDARADGLTSGSPPHRAISPAKDNTNRNNRLVKADSNSYLTPTSNNEQSLNKEMKCKGKTFPKSEVFLKVINPLDKRRVKLDIDVESDDDVFYAKETDSLRCTQI